MNSNDSHKEDIPISFLGFDYGMTLYDIDKYLEQKVLGYSDDFYKTHYEHKVLLKNGTVKTLYSTDEPNIRGMLTNMHPIIGTINKAGEESGS